ncbi:imelysin family protein [Aequorivita sp. Q41]|uniref:imelysin family protein n=1 Tax=Aequorivita sp. Q41 TaxID=3153300 RepID=UPI003242ADB4
MNYIKFGVLCIAVLIMGVSCSTDSDNPEEVPNNYDRGAMLTNWADNIIIPAYTSFNSKAAEMQTVTANFTNSPSLESLQNLRNAWEDAYLSFQNVSMFEIGKAEEIRYRNRLNVYPANTSKIQETILNGTYNFALPSNIDIQGFPALDFMLNGLAETDAEIIAFYVSNSDAEAYKAYLNALSQTILDLNTEVLADWTGGFRDAFIANTSASASGAVDKLTNDYIFYFEKALRAGKVGIPAGIFSGSPLPGNVEAFYKKDISKELLLKAIEASANFFNGKSFNGSSNGAGFKTYLEYLNTTKNGENLSALINSQFTIATNKAKELNADFVSQIETDNSKMLAAYDELQRIVIYLKVDMIQAMDISIDYVDADGD